MNPIYLANMGVKNNGNDKRSSNKVQGAVNCVQGKVIGDVNALLKQLDIDVESTEKGKEEEKSEDKKDGE